MAKIPYSGENFGWKRKKSISSLKIRTWTAIPLKVGIISTIRGLFSGGYYSLFAHNARTTEKKAREKQCRMIEIKPSLRAATQSAAAVWDKPRRAVEINPSCRSDHTRCQGGPPFFLGFLFACVNFSPEVNFFYWTFFPGKSAGAGSPVRYGQGENLHQVSRDFKNPIKKCLIYS